MWELRLRSDVNDGPSNHASSYENQSQLKSQDGLKEGPCMIVLNNGA